jgi:hypothetical protein
VRRILGFHDAVHQGIDLAMVIVQILQNAFCEAQHFSDHLMQPFGSRVRIMNTKGDAAVSHARSGTLHVFRSSFERAQLNGAPQTLCIKKRSRKFSPSALVWRGPAVTDSSIVDQDVEPIHPRLSLFGETTHLGERREVGRKESAAPPLASMSTTARAPLSASRPWTSTRAPACPSLRAPSRPTPSVEPVTGALFLLSFESQVSSSGSRSEITSRCREFEAVVLGG